MSSMGLIRPRAKKCAHTRFTVAGAKYLLSFAVSHAARAGRYGPLPVGSALSLSKNLPFAVRTVLRGSFGSGMAMARPLGPFFGPPLTALAGSVSLIVAGPFIFLASPARS